MITKHIVPKDENNQVSVPQCWRPTIRQIVRAFADEDYQIRQGIRAVRPLSEEDAARIADNVQNYGSRLVALPEQSWDTSVCQWMIGYWEVLVDLFTEEEGRSDLVLHLLVFEEEKSYSFEIQGVYVP